MIVLWSSVIFFLITISVTNGNPVVQTKYGTVRGQVEYSRYNRTYWSFVGIPFAKPPVGQLRFANPQPAEPWDGVLDAIKYGPRCLQKNYIFSRDPPSEGDEDCLYINVYVPQIPEKKSRKLPVMVSIFWGGFFAGNGDEGYFHPLYFMDYDVILVTFNYRLGVFGLLSTLDDEAPGNYALKDQVLALKWVQENIGYFGGSRKDVTIFGQSSGGTSVHLHLISPSSKGLFSKAISQSGTALVLSALSVNEVQKNITIAQASLVNCSDAIGNNAELIACLRNVSAEDLLNSQESFKTFYQFPFVAWSLVSETKTTRNPEPFLTKRSKEYMKRGQFKKLPWLVGVVQNEGLLMAPALLIPDQVREDLSKNFSAILSNLTGLSVSSSDPENLFKNMSDFYLGGKNFVNISDENWVQGFINIFSDRFFTYPLYRSLLLHLAHGHNSIYAYNFEYLGEYTFAGAFSTERERYTKHWGVAHCDDLLYQFYIPDLFDPISNPTDVAFSNTWLNVWVNFAKYGNPNPPQNQVLGNINWKPLPLGCGCRQTNRDIFLNVTGSYITGPNFKIDCGFYEDRMQFWQNTNIVENQ